jgi:DNA-binding response OmpR family regulator
VTVVLIVDDEPTVRALVRDVLEMDDYEVIEAADGPAALEAVAEHNPQLMVLDIMMPGMSGLDVLRELRRDRPGNDLPIILLTAASDDDTTWAGWTSGASVFLPKPFDPSHLLDWVERLIAQADDSGASSQEAAGDTELPSQAAGPVAEGLLTEFRGLGSND